MRAAVLGVPLDRLLRASAAALRAQALVMRRRRAHPRWPDPLGEQCPRIAHGRAQRADRVWVIAANQRHDLARQPLAHLSRRESARRPTLMIVACDPASRHELATRASDWMGIFGVAFELWLPDTPVAPPHLLAFCGRLSARASVLLSPAEAAFDGDDWDAEAFDAVEHGPRPVLRWSHGDPALPDADRVPVVIWARGAGGDIPTGGAGPRGGQTPAPSPPEGPMWAPRATIRLPAVPAQGRRYDVQRWLYRHKTALSTAAARMLFAFAGAGYRLDLSHCFFIPDCGWFLAGSLTDPCRVVTRITVAHAGGGPALDLSDFWQRVPSPRDDRVYQQFSLPEPPRGFVAFMPLEAFPTGTSPDTLHLCVQRGARKHRLRARVRTLAPGVASLRPLLDALSPDPVRLRELVARQLARPVDALWGQRAARGLEHRVDLAEAVQRFGGPPERPRVSVVIPLYGRWDFMRYQLERFARDATLHDVEWIYVVDDPRIADEVTAAADALHRVFGPPLTLVYCGENLGFSGACNLGARVARADLLLLLNSDAFPAGDGWLAAMVDRLDEDVGAVGATLVYEDHAVQHAGIAFEPFGAWPGLSIATHPGKGFPEELQPACEGSPQGITAACLLMRRADYAALGGLWDGFAVADFEDADLCARLTAAGKRLAIAPGARLYHLERQSIATIEHTGWRDMLTLYNCWQFNERLARRQRGRTA